MSLDSAIYSHLLGDYGLTFTANPATDVITAAGHTRKNNDRLRMFTTGTLPTPFVARTDYWVINAAAGVSFQMAASRGGAAIDITTTGSGTHTLGTPVTEQLADRIYPIQVPQKAIKPFLSRRQISAAAEYKMQGETGLRRARIQFDCLAADSPTLSAVTEALMQWLSGYRGLMGASSLDVRGVTMLNQLSLLVPPQEANDIEQMQHSMDFQFIYKESPPVVV